MSHLAEASVNDGTEPELCTLRYTFVDEAVKVILQGGQNTQLVKLDIENGYRIVPAHPTDRVLLGMVWK